MERLRRNHISNEDAIILYKWLTVPRVIVVMTMVTVLAVFWKLNLANFDPRPVLFIVIPVFVLLSVVLGLLIHQKKRPRLVLQIHLILDLLAITAGIYLTGGFRSAFVPLYFMVIISAGLISMPMAIGVSSAAAILYLAAIVKRQSLDNLTLMSSATNSGQSEVMSAVIFLLMIGLITFQSLYYTNSIRKKDDEVLKLKDEFLFRTVHDLRSPSSIIRLVLEKYQDPAFLEKYPDNKKDIEFVSTALGRMTNLINDMMKLGTGGSPTFALRRDKINFSETLHGVVDEQRPAMDKKKITVEFDLSNTPPMLGDAEKIKEVFTNFIDNAIKYNRDGGSISVRSRMEGKNIVTEIKDTGIGISEKSLKKLFAPYFRGDIGAEIQGTGLGLYMTKKLVEKMDGKISVTSSKNVGTTFTVTLPFITAS